MRLSGEELTRRFLLHVLPKGFMRIRHYGFLANRCRQAKLAQIRQAIGRVEEPPSAADTTERYYRCPHCKVGRLRVVAIVYPAPAPNGRPAPGGVPQRTTPS